MARKLKTIMDGLTFGEGPRWKKTNFISPTFIAIKLIH